MLYSGCRNVPILKIPQTRRNFDSHLLIRRKGTIPRVLPSRHIKLTFHGTLIQRAMTAFIVSGALVGQKSELFRWIKFPPLVVSPGHTAAGRQNLVAQIIVTDDLLRPRVAIPCSQLEHNIKINAPPPISNIISPSLNVQDSMHLLRQDVAKHGFVPPASLFSRTLTAKRVRHLRVAYVRFARTLL